MNDSERVRPFELDEETFDVYASAFGGTGVRIGKALSKDVAESLVAATERGMNAPYTSAHVVKRYLRKGELKS